MSAHEVVPLSAREDIVRGPRALPEFDLWFVIAVAALVGLGLVMVASASISIADRSLGEPLYYFRRQAAYVALGTLLGWGVLHVRLRVWRRLSPFLLIAGALALALVLVPGIGRTVNGSTRWIPLGPLNVQPSELMKLCVIMYLSGYLVRREQEVRQHLRGLLKPVAVLALIAVLFMLEPDYGATVVLFAAALGMLFLAGAPLLSFAGWFAAAGASLGVLILAAPYRLERLTTFLNPWADPFGSGFQLTQALIAIGRGGWFGVGLGNSVQKLFYLPEAYSDFIFAVIGEELGLLGMAIVIGLFVFVIWRAFLIGRRAERRGHPFGAYLAYGIALLIGLQAFINFGVNMGVLPTKGLTLPFMSYGGSSAITNCIAIALLLRVDFESRRAP